MNQQPDRDYWLEVAKRATSAEARNTVREVTS
jgi:hypothetical protein